jgi:superfamily II DNA or RNA helicase
MDTPKLVGDLAEHWFRFGERRRTVVFATGVKHSIHIRDEFRLAGVLAEHIDGGTPVEERDRILAQLAKGEVELASNAMVLTEGWDEPSVSCLVLARPTKSLGLYRQMIGRVLRPSPGKINAIILDHSGATFQHGFAEDPIVWTLDADQRATNETHAARGSSPDAPGLTTCPDCKAVRLQGKPCGSCGWHPVQKAKPVLVAEGVLGKLERDRTIRPSEPTAEQQAQFYCELLWIARENGYNPGWAAHKYKEKFGSWPTAKPWAPPPEAAMPSATTRAWVRSRQIAFAKSKQAQRRMGFR